MLVILGSCYARLLLCLVASSYLACSDDRQQPKRSLASSDARSNCLASLDARQLPFRAALYLPSIKRCKAIALALARVSKYRKIKSSIKKIAYTYKFGYKSA